MVKYLQKYEIVSINEMSEKKDLVTHLVLGLSSIDDGVGARASAGDGDKWRREDNLRLKDLAILHMRSSLVSDGPSLDMTSSSSSHVRVNVL